MDVRENHGFPPEDNTASNPNKFGVICDVFPPYSGPPDLTNPKKYLRMQVGAPLGLVTLLQKLNFQAMSKPWRLADDRGQGAPLELGPLDLVFGEAALAANLITAARCLLGRLH